MTKIIQEKYIIVLLLYISIFNLHSQELLKEVSKTFDNGQPMFIDYLEIDDLKKVKTELFNEKGTLVFSIKFNKKTGLPDGEFYDLINKGYFENGVLNCENCMLVEANSPSVYTYNNERMNTEITVGDVVKGRLVGEVKKYEQSEETYNKVDWNSTRRYVAAGAGIGFRDVKTYTTGKFTKTLVDTKVYNNNGVLDGTVNLTYTVGRYSEELKLNARLNVKNGIIKSLVSYDEKGVQRDSVSNDQKIWKVNYKYKKNNNDFLIFTSPENIIDNYGLDAENNPFFYNPFYPASINNNRSTYYGKDDTTNQVIFTLGGKQRFRRYDDYGKYHSYDTGGYKQGLDNNGLYTIRLTGMFDNIIKYDLDEINYFTGYEKYKTHYFLAYSRRENLLHIIYNTLINHKSLDKEWISSKWETKYNLKPFYDALTNLTFYKKEGVLGAPINGMRKNLKDFLIKKNSFSKYVKSNRGNLNSKQTLTYFFNNVLSISDYLKACKESVDKNYTEIQEIWVLNKKTNEYDLINFSELIKLSEEKEAKKKKEKEAAEEEKIKINKELEKTTDNSIFLKNIKLKLTSDKNSSKYSSIISKTVKRYNKSYDLKIEFLELFTSNDNKTYYRYIFNNKTDLESLKKVFSQYAQPVYIDLDNKAPSIYYKN